MWPIPRTRISHNKAGAQVQACYLLDVDSMILPNILYIDSL